MASSMMKAVGSVSGNQPRVQRIGEENGETFLQGTPVQLSAAGYVEEWDGATITEITGIATEAGANLTTAATAQTLTYGSVPNQSSAAHIPLGAPMNDGKCGIELALLDTIFWGQVGPAQTPDAADVQVAYGMTKDADDHWYVDLTKSTAGVNTVCKIIGLDENDDRGVLFVFTAGALPA